MNYRILLIGLIFIPLLAQAMSNNSPQQNSRRDFVPIVGGGISHEDYTCLKKAEFGEHLAVKKIKGIPLQEILQKIAYARDMLKRHKNQVVSSNTFLEMERMAKEAYSHTYESDVDVQTYVEQLYRTCLKSHI